MKRSNFVVVAFVLFSISVFAAPVNTASKNNGKWGSTSSWNMSRLPIINDTIIIPAGMRVVLDDNQTINGNVYIKIYGTLDIIGGKLKIGDGSTIMVYAGGSILGHNSSSEQIQFGSTFKFRGTDLLVAGPAYADSTTGSAPGGFSSGVSTLPVQFIGFNAARQQNSVLVEWSTAQEVNSSHFEVERSENGNSWYRVATVGAAGNSNEIRKYGWTDRSASGSITYYRVKEVDIDGKTQYTGVRSVKPGENELSITVASGTNNNVYIHFSQQINADVLVRITNLNGNVLNQQMIRKPVGQQIISSRNNMKGIYLVTVTDQNGLTFSQQVFL